MDDKTKPDEGGKKTKRIELVKAIRLGMAGMQLDQGDIVAEDKVKPEVFKDLLASGFFKVLLLVAVLAGFAAGPAEAQTSGTNFSYPSFIGKGNAKLDQLPTIFAAEDALFTGVRSGFHSPVADITALKAIAATGATARVDRQLCLVDSGPGAVPALYAFDATSSTAGDDDLVVAPASGTGRWFKVYAAVPDNSVTTGKIVDGAVAFSDLSLNSCTTGEAAIVNPAGTNWECSAAPVSTMTTAAAGSDLAIISGGADRSLVAGKVTLTQPATAAMITIADGKTFTSSNTLTFTGTDGSSIAFGAGGTAAYTGDKLSVFAGTTSAELAGVVSDESGTGVLAYTTSPAFTTPSLGVATATSINAVAITAPATGSTLTIADGKTLTASNTLTFTGTDASSVAFGTGGTVAYDGHTHPSAATVTSVTTSTIIGAVSVARVAPGTSTGTVAITGSSKRTGDLKVEITVAGEADGGVCKWKYQFGSEALSAEADCTAAPIAIGTTGLSASFTNGVAPLSFEDGDVFSSAITWETSLDGFDCGLITVPAMNTPGTGSPGSETVLVHWDATRIASAAAPVTISTHTSAAGMLAIDARATAASEARFTIINWGGSDWTDETGTVTLCRP